MPNSPKTHEDCRKIICLFCKIKLPTKSSNKKISGALLKKVKLIKGFENFDEKDVRYPIGCCFKHYNVIYRKKSDEAHLHLPEPFDYSQHSPTKITQSTTTCKKSCIICQIGTENCGTVGHKFGAQYPA